MNGFFLYETAQKHPDAPALFSSQGVISYSRFAEQVERAAYRLSSADIKSGERVALLGQNSPGYVVALMALLRLGAVAVPLNFRVPPDELSIRLKEIHCRIILRSTAYDACEFEGFDIAPLEAITNADAPFSAVEIAHPFSLDQEATVIFTSGSTSTPKAALHQFRSHYFNVLGSNENTQFGPSDAWLLSLPLFHVGGYSIPIRAALAGAAVAIPDPGEALEAALNRFPVTHLSLVATQLYRLLQDELATQRLRKLKAILLGGSAMPNGLIERALELGLPIHTSYGCTEMASQVTTTPPAADPEILKTSGKLLLYRQMKIAPDGEILVKGETLFSGYLRKDGLEQPFDAEGWYHTRDTGRIDEKGMLHVEGRMDNLFISGGENIQPEEIERHLCTLPDIEQAVVVPYPHPEFGERPAVFLQLREGKTLDEEALRRFLTKQIARYKIPDYFFELPEEAVGSGMKVNRAACKQLAQEYIERLKSLL
ncbi:MAG: o-succinylbenzoate--CoA ligase [Chlorobiales bacterium]|nr:o-succinylbenzoate--CoA ligase [Chlorobiales bacterium]